MNLLLLIGLPLLTAIAVLLMPSKPAVRWTAFLGSAAQLILSLNLYQAYRSARAAGEKAAFCLNSNTTGSRAGTSLSTWGWMVSRWL